MYRRRSLTASVVGSMLVVLSAAFIGSVTTVGPVPTVDRLVDSAAQGSATSQTSTKPIARTTTTSGTPSQDSDDGSDPRSNTESSFPPASDPSASESAGTSGPRVQLNASEIASELGDAIYRVETVACNGTRTSGSAWALDDQHLITNRHVVAADPDPILVSRDGRRLNGIVIGWSEEPDIAVIRVTPGSFTTSLEWADTEDLTEGQRIVSLGYPVPGRDFSVISGSIVSFQKRSGQREAIRADGALDRGNSGSPALTTDGLVAGVVTEIDQNAEGLRPIPLIFTRDALAAVVERMLGNPTTVDADCPDRIDDPEPEQPRMVSLPTGVTIGTCLTRFSAPGDRLEVFEITPCETRHEAEIYHRFTADGDDLHPGRQALNEVAESVCQEQFGEYVGLNFAFSVLDLDFRIPTISEWSSGNRTVHCWLQRGDSDSLVGSAKNAAS